MISDKALIEAEKAGVAFQIALAKIGVASIQAALALWRTVPPNKAAETADQWMTSAVHEIMSRRTLSRELALAYYRLARALRTGSTIPDPMNPIPTSVNMADLRYEFERAVQEVDRQAQSPSDGSHGSTPSLTTPERPAPSQGDSGGDTPVDSVPGITDRGDADLIRIDDEAAKEARLVLLQLGPNSLQKKVDQIDHSRPATEVDQLRDDAHSATGSRQAAAFERIVKNGARDSLTSLAERDKKVIGYVRVSRTGTPCGWCAMLISRGVVFYSSQASAEGKGDGARSVQNGNASVGDQYHDNCNCYAEPVYSMEQYNTDSRFDLNREYSELWPQVTAGLSGKEALTVWRRYFRQHSKSPSTHAQAA